MKKKSSQSEQNNSNLSINLQDIHTHVSFWRSLARIFSLANGYKRLITITSLNVYLFSDEEKKVERKIWATEKRERERKRKEWRGEVKREKQFY